MLCAFMYNSEKKRGQQSENEDEIVAGKGRESGTERERQRKRERSRQGLGNPLGNLKPSPHGSFSRSDDLSKIRTSIVHHSLSLNQTPSHLLHFISRHRPSLNAALDSTPETKGLAGTRGDPLFHFPLDVPISWMCFEWDQPGTSSFTLHATAPNKFNHFCHDIYLSMYLCIYLSIYLSNTTVFFLVPERGVMEAAIQSMVKVFVKSTKGRESLGKKEFQDLVKTQLSNILSVRKSLLNLSEMLPTLALCHCVTTSQKSTQ